MTASGLTRRVKAVMKECGISGASVRSETISFGGFGYGEACVCHVNVADAVPDAVITKLAEVEKEFRSSEDGPKFAGRAGSSFKIQLEGSPYPFRRSVSSRNEKGPHG